MNKKLKDYIKEAESLSEHPTEESRAYHNAMVAQFQHERFIHLVVTMFFALFTILFFAISIFLPFVVTPGAWGTAMVMGCEGISAILVVVLVFYIHHYYQLENGVQKLEEITKRFYKK